MGSMFRSAEMTLGQFYIQYEVAYTVVSELGELGGLVQFRDMNAHVPAMQKHYVSEIRRCEEMLRVLRLLEADIKALEIPIPDSLGSVNIPAPAPREMIDMEAYLEKRLNELTEVNANCKALNKSYVELLEFKQILLKSNQIFHQEDVGTHFDDQTPLQPSSGASKDMHLMGFIAGVILREKIPSFEVILWRLSRGNAHFREIEIEDPFVDVSGNSDPVYKNVVVIFFQGENLKVKIKKVCEAFGMAIYPCPDNIEERRNLLDGLNVRLEDLNTVVSQTQDHQFRMLKEVAQNLQEYFIKINKMKAIYHVLNMFSNSNTRKCLIGEGWIPTEDFTLVQNTIEVASNKCGSTAPSLVTPLKTHHKPPTYNKTNKFTTGFQNIVDAYGVGTYREVNPGLFTVISFPFIFAIMFGDAGHGLIMMLFALFLILKETSLKAKVKGSEIPRTFYDGRYIIFFMGLFSIYTGLIYNDIFSLSTNIFGSSWNAHNLTNEALLQKSTFDLDPTRSYRGNPYYFGIDPVWQLSKNKILYTNSYKMKLSVIFGVLQMLFGVVLSAFNHVHFKEIHAIFLEFIPQLIFMLSIFGYLVFMIVYKWLSIDPGNDTAPSLLTTLINMFMMSSPPGILYGGDTNTVQVNVQTFLVAMAALSVPVMLFGPPLYEFYERKIHFHRMTDHETEDGQDNVHDTKEEEPYSFANALINQAIHAIEFCLGSISHTASYLRLWALSLAHAQLSEVLWTMVFKIGLSSVKNYLGAISIYIIFVFWAVLTLAILLLMEGLSAFLHAIRLHWVEFQSKFYKGNGYKYEPFTFKGIVEEFS